MDKILIVDDSPVLRKILRFHLEQESGWEVCGEAENGQVAMPVMNGLEAARQIRLIAPRTITVLFTMQSCEALLPEAIAAGIKDVVSKSAGAGALLASLKALCQR